MAFYICNYSNWENLVHSYSCSPASYSAGIEPRAKKVLQHDAADALTGALSGLTGRSVTDFVGGFLGGGTKSVITCLGFPIENRDHTDYETLLHK